MQACVLQLCAAAATVTLEAAASPAAAADREPTTAGAGAGAGAGASGAPAAASANIAQYIPLPIMHGGKYPGYAAGTTSAQTVIVFEAENMTTTGGWQLGSLQNSGGGRQWVQ